jgi:rhodanese-related sulfurtransferase
MSVRMIAADDAFSLLKQANPGALHLIDVRTPAEYEQIHAQGTLLAPLDSLDPKTIIAQRNGAANDPLYVLCRSGTRAAKACQKFAAAGFENVFVIEGGTEAWERAGLPVVRGTSRVISLERQVRIAAGALVLTGIALGTFVHPALYGLSAFIGAGLVFAGITDWCGMAMVLAKMPWNKRPKAHKSVRAALPKRSAKVSPSKIG